MTKHPLSDFRHETIVVLEEPIGNEVRRTFYERREDGPVRHPQNVRVARLRTVQGVPGEAPRFDTGFEYCIDPGEADGRVAVREALSDEIGQIPKPIFGPAI